MPSTGPRCDGAGYSWDLKCKTQVSAKQGGQTQGFIHIPVYRLFNSKHLTHLTSDCGLWGDFAHQESPVSPITLSAACITHFTSKKATTRGFLHTNTEACNNAWGFINPKQMLWDERSRRCKRILGPVIQRNAGQDFALISTCTHVTVNRHPPCMNESYEWAFALWRTGMPTWVFLPSSRLTVTLCTQAIVKCGQTVSLQPKWNLMKAKPAIGIPPPPPPNLNDRWDVDCRFIGQCLITTMSVLRI